jgi:threonine dehydrogenase-like Zn-dependent dehydrogenase
MTPKIMRAARYYGKEDVRIEHTPRPQLAPGQILIKPSHVGICGTDLHEYIAGPTCVHLSLLQKPISYHLYQNL